MDGLAYGVDTPEAAGNAVEAARTPVLDDLVSRYPSTLLRASGTAVGLPEGQMGNSEVGHLNIGAGRTVFQELTRIDNAIVEGTFFENPVLIESFDKAICAGKTIHLMGLVSDGGVHSSTRHLFALIDLAKQRGATDVAIHCFLDGRDTPPKSGRGYVAELEAFTKTQGIGHVATLCGRYYAMDRDERYDRVKRAYDLLVAPEAPKFWNSDEAFEASYSAGITDEFFEPTVLAPSPVGDGDTLVFFNFRPDRAREITRAFTDKSFDGFSRTIRPDCTFVSLTEYDPSIDALVAYPKVFLKETLADVLAAHNLRQLHIAETEKYAHVTFFFNGGAEEPKEGETRILIPSPKVATYDLVPEMSSVAVGDALVEAIHRHDSDVFIVNFANGDMVGHTGIFEAAVKAVEAVDTQVGRVVEAISAQGGTTFITADHGNCEQMYELCDGGKFTAHTCNDVPLIVVSDSAKMVKPGTLADIAPTMLGVLEIPAPASWSGTNLVVY